jgi:hypothetical protein
MAHFIAMDSPASGKVTQELMKWEPTQQGLIADLEENHYFTR